jgi:hypothetical protein
MLGLSLNINFVLVIALTSQMFAVEVNVEKATATGQVIAVSGNIAYKKGDILQIVGYDNTGNYILSVSQLALWIKKNDDKWLKYQPSRGGVVVGGTKQDIEADKDGKIDYTFSVDPKVDDVKIEIGTNISVGYMKASSAYTPLK